MSKPSPQTLAAELDWMFTNLDPNPVFFHAAETLKELYIENHRLREEKGFTPPERPIEVEIRWAE